MFINTKLQCKEPEIEMNKVVIQAVEKLHFNDFKHFKNNLLDDYDFISDNLHNMYYEGDECHALLVISNYHDDGIIVDSSGHSYARYSAVLPQAKALLDNHLEKKADRIFNKLTDFSKENNYNIDIKDLKIFFNVDFDKGGLMGQMLKDKLINIKGVDSITATENSFVINLNEKVMNDITQQQDKIIQACSSNVWIMDTDYEYEDYDFYFQKFDGKVDLKNYFDDGNKALREVVLYEDLAFVQQVNGGDEWLALRDKGDHYEDFESISFKAIIQNHGETEFYNYLKSLVDDTDYSFVREMNEPQM